MKTTKEILEVANEIVDESKWIIGFFNKFGIDILNLGFSSGGVLPPRDYIGKK